jgi:transcriptional regulator of acetoin/glycerol metabolism
MGQPERGDAASESGQQSQRPDVVNAWRRAVLNGLSPGVALHELAVSDVDVQTRLSRAVQPILAQLEDEFSDTPYGLIVADRGAHLIEVRSARHQLITDLEANGIAVGRRFAEETTGNNSVATAHELRTGVAVRGGEHFLEALRSYACYGHPVINPFTRRVEGVLSVVGFARSDNPLLASYLARVSREVEHRLVQSARLRDQHLLAAFQVASSRRQEPVLVLGPDVTMANPAAMERLDQTDHQSLRLLAEDAPAGSGAVRRIELASGQAVDVELRRVPDASDGVLLRVLRSAPAFHAAGEKVPATAGSRQWPRRSRRLLISGEPGTGKSTCLGEMTAGEDVDVLFAGDVLSESSAWFEQLTKMAALPAGVLAVEDIHLLDTRAAQLLRYAVQDTDRRLAMTSGPVDTLDAAHADLAALCPERIELSPLRDRRADFAMLTTAMLAASGAGRSVRFTPATLDVLAGNPWPGNLRELDAVVRETLRVRTSGDIMPADLPPAYRTSPRRRWMTPLERAEHDTILSVLRVHSGNKAHAARELGISRTTLYNRMRTLRIPEI